MKEQPRYIESDQLVFDIDSYTKVIGRHEGERLVLYQLASLGSRLYACLIDYVFLIALALVFGGTLYLFNPDFYGKKTAGRFLFLLFLEWNVLYFMFFESFTRGFTPGKRILGIQVISKSENKHFTGVSSVLRNLGRVIDFFPMFGLMGGGLIWLSGKRQRVGDVFAGTIVVYSSPLTEQLEQVRVSPQLFSTSVDGYYIEGVLNRLNELSPGARMHLSKEVACYLKSKYSSFNGDAEFAFQQERYVDFLYALLRDR